MKKIANSFLLSIIIPGKYEKSKFKTNLAHKYFSNFPACLHCSFTQDGSGSSQSSCHQLKCFQAVSHLFQWQTRQKPTVLHTNLVNCLPMAFSQSPLQLCQTLRINTLLKCIFVITTGGYTLEFGFKVSKSGGSSEQAL